MLVSFTIRLSRECNACKMSLPVNGIVDGVRCYHCGELNQLGADFWTTALDRDGFAEALAGVDGEASESNVMSGQGNYTLAHGKRAPRCQACKGPDLDPMALAGFVAIGQCFCPACGQPLRVRNADALVRAINDRAVGVVGETAASAGEQAIQAKTTPVLFQCMGCGGGLTVDGATRSVTCRYCNAPNYLPDGLWRQLHPVPRPQVFFLICDYDAAAMVRVALDGDSDARTALAGNPTTAPDVLMQLLGDDDYEVRVAAARNYATPPPGLVHLAADDDSDVIRALAARGDLPPEACDRLAAHSDSDHRKLIAGHPNLPLASLHRLASDDDDDVRQAARQRLQALRAQGVDVGSAPGGFFGKLFGA